MKFLLGFLQLNEIEWFPGKRKDQFKNIGLLILIVKTPYWIQCYSRQDIQRLEWMADTSYWTMEP